MWRRLRLCPSRGIPVADNQYAGGPFEWLAPLPILCGIGLILGYALLGAGWLVLKTDDQLREWVRRRMPWLALGVLIALGIAFAAALSDRERIAADLADRRWGLIFPLAGLLAMPGIFRSPRRHRDWWPFAMTVTFFIAAFLSSALLFWPYMIPYAIMVARAAAPDKSLSVLFWGAGIFVLPVVICYTAVA